jgi:hypothetical protein
MTIKQSALHTFSSAALASIACIIYNTIYSKAFDVNFSMVLNMGGIIGSCVFGCVLMATTYHIAIKWKGDKLLGWLNIVFALLSFVSIIGVLGFQLPISIESPEMFPGLAIPMHFFPLLGFLTIAPFFKPKSKVFHSPLS